MEPIKASLEFQRAVTHVDDLVFGSSQNASQRKNAIEILSRLNSPKEGPPLGTRGEALLSLASNIRNPKEQAEFSCFVERNLKKLTIDLALSEGLGGGFQDYNNLMPDKRYAAFVYFDQMALILRENPELTWTVLLGDGCGWNGICLSYILNESELLLRCLRDESVPLAVFEDLDDEISLLDRKELFEALTEEQKMACQNGFTFYIQVCEHRWGLSKEQALLFATAFDSVKYLLENTGLSIDQIAKIFGNENRFAQIAHIGVFVSLAQKGVDVKKWFDEINYLYKRLDPPKLVSLFPVFCEDVNFDVLKTNLDFIADQLMYGGNIEDIVSQIPRLVQRSPLNPPSIGVDTEKLRLLSDPNLLEETMSRAEDGTLFQFVPNYEKRKIAIDMAIVAGKAETRSKIAHLLAHIKNEEHNPQFWTHEMFLDENIDSYICLAHLMGYLSIEELATLHTTVAFLKFYRDQGTPVITVPLFSSDGSINPAADQMIAESMQMQNSVKRKAWFDRVRKLAPMERYFLYAPKREWIGRSVQKGEMLEKGMSVMERISDNRNGGLRVNIGYSVNKNFHFVPSIGASLEMLDVISKNKCPKPVFHYGLGISEFMREEHRQGMRTVSLQTNFYKIPEVADGYYAPAGELTLHDLLYHFYVAGFIPQEDMEFFMDFSEALEGRAKSLKNSPDERDRCDAEALMYMDYWLIDAELTGYTLKQPHSVKFHKSLNAFLEDKRLKRCINSIESIPPEERSEALERLKGHMIEVREQFMRQYQEKHPKSGITSYFF